MREPKDAYFIEAKTLRSLAEIVLIAVCYFSIVSCGQASLEDCSLEPQFSIAIGKSFSTKEDLLAFGITADANYKKRVDYIILIPEPGVSGPEVVTKEVLKKGTVVRVVRVLKTTGFALRKIIFIVEDVSTKKYEGIQIRVNQTGKIDDSNFGLDQAIFQKMGQ